MTASRKKGLSADEQVFVENCASNIVTFMSSAEFHESAFEWAWTMSERVAEILEDDSIEAGEMSGIEQALNVKKAIRRKLCSSVSDSDRLELFRWFVKDYGKVTGNKQLDDKIRSTWALSEHYVVDSAYKLGLKGISTTSKCLTLLHERLPIYDSRVCYALNAINYVHDTREWYFKGPDGRNASIGLIDVRAQFLLCDVVRLDEAIAVLESGHKKRASKAISAMEMPPKRTYGLWCEILATASDQMKSKEAIRSSIDELEILLFACAPTVCTVQLAKKLRSELFARSKI